MRIYLDACSIQRPLDTKSQIRIVLEAEAVLGIMSLIESGHADLVSSEALEFETEQNPNLIRREYAHEVLSRAAFIATINEQVEVRARRYHKISILAHLALAEEAQTDFFCTCDDKLFKKARRIEELKVRVVSPVELIEEIEK